MIKRRVDHSFRHSLSENNKRYEGCPVDMGQPSSWFSHVFVIGMSLPGK